MACNWVLSALCLKVAVYLCFLNSIFTFFRDRIALFSVDPLYITNFNTNVAMPVCLFFNHLKTEGLT